MRKKPPIIRITLIISLLIVNGILFVYTLNNQKQELDEREKATRLQIVEAASEADKAAQGAEDAAMQEIEKVAQAEAAKHVYSHRGASIAEIEHTIEAYDRAVEEGSKYLEQDVVISKNKTLYVSHDESAARLTGVNRNYRDMTDAEIDQLRTANGEKILRLTDVFDRYGTEVNYVIELKDKKDGTVKAFRKVVNQYGFADRIIVQCSSVKVLERLEKYYPDMQKLYLSHSQDGFSYGLQLSFVDIVSVEKSRMTEDNCRRAHKKGKQFNVWVLNREDEIRSAIRMGVDSYFTNDTALALTIEREDRIGAMYEKKTRIW